jgi:hypothetical protein
MKLPLSTLALCCCLAVSPAFAQEPQEKITLETLHKKLISTVENELASNKDLEAGYAAHLKAMIPVWRENPSRNSIEQRLVQFKSFISRGNVSQKTKDSVDLYVMQISDLIKKQSDQSVEDITKFAGESIRRVMKSTDPEEIRKLIAEFVDYRSKMASGEFRDESISSSKLSAVTQFMDYSLKFHEYRVSESWSSAAGQIRNMEQTTAVLSFCVTADEMKQFLEGLRKSIGVLPPKEFEALLNQSIDDLLNDANQDRVDEIMQQVRKYSQLNGSSSSGEMLAMRCQSLESLGRQLQESIRKGRAGSNPQFRATDLIRSDSSYGKLMKPEELETRLKKYTIRFKDKEGATMESRLYYDVGELTIICENILAEILHDANQDRYPEILAKISAYRYYASAFSSSDGSSLSTRFDKLSYLAKNVGDIVKILQRGENPQINLNQMLNSYSDGITLLSREELLEKLKRYNVKVTEKSGTIVLRPLYVDAEEVLQSVSSLSELPQALPELKRAVSIGSDADDRNSSMRWFPSIARCAEWAEKLESGDSFILTPPYSGQYYGSDSPRSVLSTTPNPESLKKLEAEAEWAVIKRFFPKEEYGKAEDHEVVIKNLMKRFLHEKNYEAIDQLQRVSFYFKPARNLLSQGQAQAIRDYLDGVRQEEVLDQPRLAVFHYQKVAASQTTVIDDDHLKARLQSLRKKFPADYDKGIEDAMRTPAAAVAPKEIEVPAAAK